MKTRAVVPARCFMTAENGYMFAANTRWFLPVMIERTLWDVLTIREEDADRLAKWRDPARE